MNNQNRKVAEITYNSYDFPFTHRNDKGSPDDYVNSCLLALNYLSLTPTANEIALMIVGVSIDPRVIEKTKGGESVSVAIREKHLSNSLEYFRNRLIKNTIKDSEDIRKGIGELICILDVFLHNIRTSIGPLYYNKDLHTFTYNRKEES